MPKTHVRVLGGGNTYVTVGLDGGNTIVEFLARLQDQPGRVNGGPVEIQGIGDKYPVEIATGYSQKAGTLTLEVWQTWGKDGWVSAFMTTGIDGSMSDSVGIWDAFRNKNANNSGNNQLDGYPVDLVEVLEAQRLNPSFIEVCKFEKGADGSIARVKNYHGCVITGIQADETVQNETMENRVRIDMMYTHVTVTSA